MKKIFMGIMVFSSMATQGQEVKYGEGMITLNGINFLQDARNPLSYYYLPAYIQLSRSTDNILDFLCVGYGENNNGGGGMLRAKFDLAIPASVLSQCQKDLTGKIPGAKIVGRIPMADGEETSLSLKNEFKLVRHHFWKSEEKDTVTSYTVTSGPVKQNPDGKFAVASVYAAGKTFALWHSLNNPGKH